MKLNTFNMTLTKKAPVALLLTGVLLLDGCALKQMVKMAKDQQLTVTPSPLEVHGDSVKFDLSASLPLKMLKKNKIYTLNTAYKYGDQKINLADVEFKSTDFPNAKTEQPKVSKAFSFGYKPEIGNGDLVVVGTASNITKSKSKSSAEMPVAKGLITTSRLVKDIYYSAYAEHGYNNKEELIPVNVGFYFEQGSAKLTNKETKGSEAKNLDAFLAKKNATRTVTIIGYHSPEGTEAKNSKLAEERAKVIEKYYKDRMKYFNQKNVIDSINFVTKSVFQDWEPLKARLDSTTALSAEEKSEVLGIINGSSSFLDKEKELEKLKSFKKLITKVYPELRTAKTEILTVKPKKTDLQISLLAKEISEKGLNADTLNYNELAYAATLTPILTEKEAVYTALIKKQDTWDAHNNLGAVYLEMAAKAIDNGTRIANADKAINQLELSLKIKDNAEARTNLAVAYLIKGLKDQATAEIQKADALQASTELKKGINAVKGTLEIKQAKYNDAIQSLSKANETNEVLYNLALANLLSRNFEAAKNGFEAVTAGNDKNAWGYYLSAVTAARLKDEGNLTKNLKRAVQLDSKLTEKALNDVEFLEYQNSENFKNAIK